MSAAKSLDFSKKFNRILYVGFIIMAAYFVFISKDYGSALSNAGIALAFDPFDQQVKWNDRPLYQRVWLIVHVTLVLAGLIYGLVNGFKF
jgi:hypothetical protein